MWGAWHAAAFTRGKRLPRLDGVMRRLGVRAPEQTPEQALKLAERLNALWGGKDLRKKER
ncbi:hypothetical protein BH10PSE7_BH10PSE7_15510 [soil metagenome]